MNVCPKCQQVREPYRKGEGRICKECRAAQTSAYSKRTRAGINQQRTERRHADPERARAEDREYKEKNSDRLKAQQRIRYWNNLDKFRKKARDHQKAHPDRFCARSRKRYALQLGAVPVGREADPRVEAVYEIAAWLRKQGDRVAVDHVMPLVKGGLHVYENLQIITHSENNRKGARSPNATELEVIETLKQSMSEVS